MMEHPADSFIDYNFMVDNLEEEHLRRDVFTTAIEEKGPEGEVDTLLKKRKRKDGGAEEKKSGKVNGPNPAKGNRLNDRKPLVTNYKTLSKAKAKQLQATQKVTRGTT